MEASEKLIAVPSIVFMGISIAICIILPLFGIIFSWKKGKAAYSSKERKKAILPPTVLSAVMGLICYGLGLLTYVVLWSVYVVLVTDDTKITDLPMSCYVVRGLLAGIAFAFWALLIRRKLSKKRGGFWENISFYSGFSLGCGWIVIDFPSLIRKMALSLKYNPMGTEKAIELLQGGKDELEKAENTQTLNRLYEISKSNFSSSDFLLPGIEFLLLCLSFFFIGCLLHKATEQKKMLSLWALLVLLFHIALEVPLQLGLGNEQTNQMIPNLLIETATKEVLLGIVAALAGIAVFMAYFRKRDSGVKRS